MSISTIGGIMYANQGMPAAAQLHKEQLARVDFQGAVMQEMFKEKEAEVEEARPPEETAAIHPEGHGSGGDGTYHPPRKGAKDADKQEEESEPAASPHLLDILA